MFNGENKSGKQFEVVNEEREVTGAFDTIAEALAYGKAAHWTNGVCDIRRHRPAPVTKAAKWWTCPELHINAA